MSIAKKLAPSELVEEKGVLKSVEHAPEELTHEEKQLHGRTMAALDKALRAHGVSLTGNELHHLAAEVADFVIEEKMGRAVAKGEVEEPPKKKTAK